MPLWVDKYQPDSIDDLTINPTLTNRLKRLAQTGDLPHLLFYGPSGAGKKTRVNALLKEIFGGGVEKLKLERKSFKTPSNKVIELTALGSNYHVEMNPSDVGIYDRIVIQEVIKEIASSQVVVAQPGGSSSSSSSSSSSTRPNFKVVVLNEADQLTRLAQHGLRRTMEKYVGSCRLILVSESLSKVIEPVRSRCLAIRVPAPSEDEIEAAVAKVFRLEDVAATPNFTRSLARASQGNLRRALLMAEASRVGMAADGEMKLQLPDWERYIAQLAREITAAQSPQALLEARAKLYELLANCIPPDLIFKTLTEELCRSLDDDLKFEVVKWAAFYEARLASGGQKAIFHLEAFVAKFMAVYKKYLFDMFG